MKIVLCSEWGGFGRLVIFMELSWRCSGCVHPDGTSSTSEWRSGRWYGLSAAYVSVRSSTTRPPCRLGCSDPAQIPSHGPIRWNACTSKGHRSITDSGLPLIGIMWV